MTKISTSLVSLILDLFGWDDAEPSMMVVVHEVMAPLWKKFLSEELGEENHPDYSPGGSWCFGDNLAHESLYFRGLVPIYIRLSDKNAGDLVDRLIVETGKRTLVINHMDSCSKEDVEKWVSGYRIVRSWEDKASSWWEMPICPECGRAVSLTPDKICSDCLQTNLDF